MKNMNLFSKYNFICLFLLITFMSGIYYFVFDIDMQRCEMTYMFEYPEYKKYVIAEAKNQARFKWYGLYHYREGHVDEKLRGVPVLFIPGNSGSYKQVRSLASVSRQMSLKKGGHQKFDYFSVDLNEELSCTSGAIVRKQIEFVALVIGHIEGLYGNGTRVVLVGHSMGGFVARAMVPRMETVELIVALAAPMELPVAGLDRDLVALYDEVNESWRNGRGIDHVTVVSLTGGDRDVLVWDGYGQVERAKRSMWRPVRAVVSVWASTDHLCIVWCRQLVVALNRALYRSLPVLASSRHDPSIDSSQLLASFQNQLSSVTTTGETVPVCPSTVTVDASYASLVMWPWKVDIPNDTCLQLAALAVVTRPIRIQISSGNCMTPISQANLFVPHLGHSYHYSLQNLSSVPLGLPAAAHEQFPLLNIKLTHHCDLTVTVSASLLDWVTYLIRIHVGMLPSLVSGLLILHIFGMGGPLPVAAFALASPVVAIAYRAGTGGIQKLQANGIIDMYDLVLLICLSLPLARCLVLLCAVFIRSCGLIARAMPFAQLMSPSLLWCLPCLLLSVGAPNVPLLGSFSLFVLYLISIACKYRHYSLLGLPPRVVTNSAVILMIALLEAPPSLAQIHSAMQHESVRHLVQQWLFSLTRISSYGISISFVMLVVTALFSYLHEEADYDKHSIFNTLVQWTCGFVLASACVIHGSLDMYWCSSFLLTGLIMSETTHFVTA